MSKKLEMELLNSEEARGIKGGDIDPIWCTTVEVNICTTVEIKKCLTIESPNCQKNGTVIIAPTPTDDIVAAP